MEQIKPIKSDYEVLIEMAEEISKLNNELGIIRNEKSSAILILKSESKTWKEAEYKWGASPQGKRENVLVYMLKGLSERKSALRAKINGDRAY